MMTLFFKSLGETLWMVGAASLISFLIGVLLALALWVTSPQGLKPWVFLHHSLGFLINALRSIPYIILVVLMMPITKVLVGTSIGSSAALVPLTLAGILLMARGIDDVFKALPGGLIEVGVAFGGTTSQILRTILLRESWPGIISAVTTVVINLIGFSAMAGAVGGGGLGDLAIRYGYQRYDIELMIIIVVALIVLVQGVQMMGDRISRSLQHSCKT